MSDASDDLARRIRATLGLRPDLSSLSAQLLSNTLTGCTSLMNRALLEKALPVPPEAIMHDWWLSLVASALGRATKKASFSWGRPMDTRSHSGKP